MTHHPITRRHFVSRATLFLGALGLDACGGGQDPTLAPSPGTTSPPPASPGKSPSQAPPPPPPVGTVFTSLSVQAGSAAGTLPYSATLMPTEGAVPAGNTLQSPDDGSLHASILSTWPDGSAAVVVVSGQVGVTSDESKVLRIQAGAPDSRAALTASHITALVTQVSVDFGTLGAATIANLASPERVWWANAQTICARYRAAAPGHATLEAVIDIHAFSSNRALVEVVVENAKFDAQTATSSSGPAAAAYASASVSVNGATVATVSGMSAPGGNHGALRAWYAASWVGGDPTLSVTQLHTDLQKHPLLFKCDQAASFNMAGYEADAYTPWSTGRHRATNMGGTGDHPSIGPLPQWESRALQSGDHRAWQATEASALAMLSYNINCRDVSGVIPHSAIMPLKCQGSFWANWPRNNTEPAFEAAHQPAAGLMAFLARPSPVYIEIAQKIGVWTGTVDSSRDLLNGFDAASVGVTDCTGIMGNQQIRTKAWGPRSIAHATWLSPDVHPWKDGGIEWLDRNARYLNAFRLNGRATVLPLWEGGPNWPEDVDTGMTGYQVSLWMYHFVVTEWHKIASSRLLAKRNDSRQVAADTVVDGLASSVVKWVTEQPNGGWRFMPYRTRLGDLSGNMTAFTSWNAQRAADFTGSPSTISGRWGGGVGDETTWLAVEARGFDASAGIGYPSVFMAALTASVERSVPNSTQAWTTVQQSITDMSAWRAGFAFEPRWSATPRNL